MIRYSLVFIIALIAGLCFGWYGNIDWTVRSADHALGLLTCFWWSGVAVYISWCREDSRARKGASHD